MGQGNAEVQVGEKDVPMGEVQSKLCFLWKPIYLFFFSRRYFQLPCNLILEAAPRGSSLHFQLEGRRVDQWFLTELEGQLSHRLLLKFLIFSHQKVNNR